MHDAIKKYTHNKNADPLIPKEWRARDPLIIPFTQTCIGVPLLVQVRWNRRFTVQILLSTKICRAILFLRTILPSPISGGALLF